MPCYSTITTKLTDLEAVKVGAEQLGYRVTHSGSVLRITGQGVSYLSIFTVRGEKFLEANAPGTGDSQALTKITRQYAVNKLKAVAQRKGFMVSQGSKPNQYVLTSFK